MLIIDGSYLEGGGQILRTAIALSMLTGIPFRAINIRKNRPKPGLKHQHLACIEALTKSSNAQAEGATLGSETIEFFPHPITTPQTISLDIGTAGSITLLLQSILLPSIFAKDRMRFIIKGGTDTRWSIPLDYFTHLIIPFYSEFADIKILNKRRGFYPKGNGQIDIEIIPKWNYNLSHHFDLFIGDLRKAYSMIQLTQPPSDISIEGISCASKALKKSEVAKRQIEGACLRIGNRYPIRIQEEYADTKSYGSVITLWATSHNSRKTIGADSLGEKGVRAEVVGEKAASRLLDVIDSGAGIDSHLADNLIPLLALIGGAIKPEAITDHILSNIYVCESFLPIKFVVEHNEKTIRVER